DGAAAPRDGRGRAGGGDPPAGRGDRSGSARRHRRGAGNGRRGRMTAALRLGVNVDHVATLREVRGVDYPDPVAAALLAQAAAAGIRVSLFVDPDDAQLRAGAETGARAVELHTGDYANAGAAGRELERLRAAARTAAGLGLGVHAGHGLTVANVEPVAAIPEVVELNIGHSIVAR